MQNDKRIYNNVDGIIDILKRGLSIDDRYFSIFGQATEQQKQQQKTLDYNIAIQETTEQILTCQPGYGRIKQDDKIYEVVLKRCTQGYNIIVFSNRNDKPELARTIIERCWAILNTTKTKKVLNHSFQILRVGDMHNLSILESEEKDNLIRYQFDFKIAYTVEIPGREIGQATLQLQSIEMKK